ncbi:MULTISPECIES: hypothetical protein [unclassified Paenibacillus]|uniref:hypothetical protein n=1 Tax=unclassified Paenibacillus TaxID=185978 RepID=UPI001FAE63EA|nr:MULTISPECIES: hypothetical protein [unclassified Paenibacillus]
MTIALQKFKRTQQMNVSNTYKLSDPSYNRNITLEQLYLEFEIKPTAIIIIELMEFYLRTVERMNEFAIRMPEEQFPLTLLRKMRNEDIDKYGYRNKHSFVHDYYKDKRLALEQLFQEPVHQWTMNTFKTSDPERIFDVYLEQGKYSNIRKVSMLA